MHSVPAPTGETSKISGFIRVVSHSGQILGRRKGMFGYNWLIFLLVLLIGNVWADSGTKYGYEFIKVETRAKLAKSWRLTLCRVPMA